MKKMKLKHIMLMTVLYIIATLSLVILSNQNILENDTNRVLKTIDKIQLFLEKHPDITRLAVAFDFQILDLVPTEPTDICPQIIVTQSKVYRREDL